MIATALEYFRAFAAKDVQRLTDLLDPGVTLRDWATQASGKEAVLREMQCTFDAFTVIEVDVATVMDSGSVVAAELEIRLDAETLKVVDLLEFSPAAQIRAIRAFKG